MAEMSEAAREARNAYQREWYRKNKDKAKDSQARYWEHKAAKAKEQQAKAAEQAETINVGSRDGGVPWIIQRLEER